MIRVVWRRLRPLLSAARKRALGLLALESLVAGLLEALLLMLVVAAALAVAGDHEMIDLAMPLLGRLEFRPATALVVASVAGVVALAIHLHAAWLMARLSAGVLKTARDRAVSAFANASWDRQAREREGALQETVSTLSSQTSALVAYLSDFASAVFGLMALIFVAIVIDPLVTLVVLLLGALLFTATRPVSRLTQSRSRNYVTTNSRFAEQVAQWSALAMELRVFGVEHKEAQHLAEHNAAASRALARSRFVTRVGGELFRDLAILFLVAAVAALYLIEDADLVAVGSVVLLVIRSLTYAQKANSSLQMINEYSPNLESFIKRVESLEVTAQPSGTKTVDEIGQVRLHDVGYDYELGRPGIDGVTIEIGAGEAIGVIGPSGGGKSTLAQVLLRLRPATRGTVTVSGIRYEEIRPDSWSRLVALVSQEPKLFQGSVADNISFFRSHITRQDIHEAAAAANVLEDIRRLPGGFDTELEPRGGGLSGGQRQRIAIARALVGKPKLLVLDEPTSALDVRSEQLLQRTVEELKSRVTLVIIAHRMTTLACCDRVVALEDGQVKLIGTLSEARGSVAFDDILTADRTDRHSSSG